MENFLTHALGGAIAPFLVVGMLFVAYPFKRAAQGMQDSRLKRLLLKRVGGANGRPDPQQAHQGIRDLRHLTPDQARAVLGIRE